MNAGTSTRPSTPADAHPANPFEQAGYRARFDWGPNGLRTLAPLAAVVVIVDVLRFTSAVSVATACGGVVLPYRWADDRGPAYAAERSAILAGRRERGEWSLSPAGLATLPAGSRLVLPSPNGSALSFAARDHGARHVLAGCLRNATATAAHAVQVAGVTGVIAVIAAGERWRNHTGPVRPAIEDLLGAGAILDGVARLLDPTELSPEAATARAAFGEARPVIAERVARCGSGVELAERGWYDDLAACSDLDICDVAAELIDEAFVATSTQSTRRRPDGVIDGSALGSSTTNSVR